MSPVDGYRWFSLWITQIKIARLWNLVVIIVLPQVTPPFIKNKVLAEEFSRYGQLVSPLQMVSLGCKLFLLKHVVCIVLKDNIEELNLSFYFRIDGFSYMVFVTTETIKCIGCGAEKHLII